MLRWFLASIALAATISTSIAGYTMSVVPAVGPDLGLNGPTFVAWENNVITGLRNVASGNASYYQTGNPTLPSFYAPAGYSQNGGAINKLNGPAPFPGAVTGLWNGLANPTGAFAGQTGNWMYWGLAIRTSAGDTFTAANVSFNGTGNSTFGGLIPNGTAAGSVVGGSNLLFGSSTIGGPLFAINAGNQNTPLMELYYVGKGVSIGNNNGDFTDANSLNALMLPPLTPQGIISGGYTLTGIAGGPLSLTAGVDINSVPAPATFALMGLGLAGLVARVRRRHA